MWKGAYKTRVNMNLAWCNEDENRCAAVVPKHPVKVGDLVTAGETVVVLEAMKMQSNYKVNSDCYIKEILVAEGDSVNNDQVLIRLDLNVEKEESDGK